ncbi:hypothetical protein P4S72_13810 [Vibrio sp. PP-XX7]
MSTLAPFDRLVQLHQALITHGVMPKNTRLNDFVAIYRVFSTHIRTHFKPTTFPQTRMRLMLASDTSAERWPGWQALCPEITMVEKCL